MSSGGFIPCVSFGLGSKAARADADRVEEDAGHTGEWVTLVHRNIHGQAITYRRRGRSVYATREEALKAARVTVREIKAGKREAL
jgi:hypothetical protein